MPRTRPDRTEEVRISLSNKEREFIAKQIQINSNKAWLGPLIGNFGTVVIGTGAVLGGYALWKWVGGFSPMETLKDQLAEIAEDIGGGLYHVVRGESVEETTDRWMNVMTDKIDKIETTCAHRRRLPEQVLANPDASENQKAQAQRELAQINEYCRKRIQEARDKNLNRLAAFHAMSQVNPLQQLPIIGGIFR